MEFSTIYYTILMIAGIGVIIFVHELGHFLVAKWADVKVEAFSLGFGPALIQKRIGETVYKLCVIPLGGYVKMTGETPGDATTGDPREFSSKSVAARAAIISAGVIMNFLFACLIFPVIFSIGLSMDVPVVGRLEPGRPAWVEGIEPGDRILAINGQEIHSYIDVNYEVALADGPLKFDLERGGERRTVHVTPEYNSAYGYPIVGIERSLEYRVKPRPGHTVDGLDGTARLLGVSVNGVSTSRASEFEKVLTEAQKEPSATVVLVVDKQGVPTSLTFPPNPTEEDTWFLGVEFAASNKVKAVRHGHADLMLAKGDRVVSVDGKPVNNQKAIREAVLQAPPGPVAMTIKRAKDADREVKLKVEALADPGRRSALLDDILFEFDPSSRVVNLIPGLAAEKAGFKSGDRIVKVDGKKVGEVDDVKRLIEGFAPERQGGTMTFTVERVLNQGGKFVVRTVNLKAKPAKRVENDALAAVQMGKTPIQTNVRFPFPESVVKGLHYTKIWTFNILRTLKRMFTGKLSIKNLGGIITIGVVTYESAEKGFNNLLYFLAILSVNLAIINLLPIPILDGGHLMFLLIEKVKGSPVSERVVGVSHAIGLAIILALIVFVTFNDIQRWIFP
jgi:regulator of sigma E protease